MFDYTNVSLERDSWGKRDRTYDEECASHEIKVDIVDDVVRDIILERGMLRFARSRKPLGR
eukprot:7852276-Pyramimonas_sp.AAC.2